MAWVPDTNWMRPKAASAPNTSANTCTRGTSVAIAPRECKWRSHLCNDATGRRHLQAVKRRLRLFLGKAANSFGQEESGGGGGAGGGAGEQSGNTCSVVKEAALTDHA